MSSAKNYEIMSALLDYYVNQYLGRRDEMFNTDKLLLKFSTFPFLYLHWMNHIDIITKNLFLEIESYLFHYIWYPQIIYFLFLFDISLKSYGRGKSENHIVKNDTVS